VEKLRAPLLISHGTGDLNAPYSECEKLVSALVREGKEFELIVYPGEPHAWLGPETWRDYIKRMGRFLDRHLRFRSLS